MDLIHGVANSPNQVGPVQLGGSMGALGGFGAHQTWAEFAKAVTADHVVSPADLVGGGALRRQSLESTLLAVLQSQNDFELFNKLNKSQATATIDEYTVVDDTGSWPGGAVNSELGDIVESTGNYKRYVLQMKYLMDRRRVSVVQDVQGGIAAATATEQMLSTLAILTTAEWLLFNGDDEVVPEEFAGLNKIITATHPENVIDLKGSSFDPHAAEITDAAGRVSKAGTWGRSSDLFCSVGAQIDLDHGLDPAHRVQVLNVPGGGIQLGAPVNGIRSSFANGKQIAVTNDKFIEEGGPPFALAYPNASQGADAPAAPATVAVTSPAVGGFTAEWQGDYVYAVEAINRSGRSAITSGNAAATTTGANGGRLVITPGAETAANAATGFVIYRSPKDGAAGTGGANLREVARIKRAATATTTWDDTNALIPGTSRAYLLNLTPGMMAADIRRLMALTRFNLYPTSRAEIPWAQLLFLALRVTKPMQHIIFKNYLPKNQTWRPR